ncbi:unnamed protein product [Enterobius vermicularis]|uniref:Helicase ATP-binding domain-containing protein n=1 Tax=Enterobius vermicularis TaxID=51028 RepID=A0A0N4USL0_ENTVE|nr:unnamed protein product [Enterobius vermicularis]
MDLVGFAHLRIPQKIVSNQKPLRTYFKTTVPIAEDFKSTSSFQEDSFSRLYVSVNVPPCSFHSQLTIDAMKSNLLVALPKAMDPLFIGFTLAFNFRRWFPAKKIVFIAASLDKAVRMKSDFVVRTGYPETEVCVYGSKRKFQRRYEWERHSVIFATAETLLADMKDSFGCEVGLLIVEEAERAANGSNSVCMLTRNLLLAKAAYRILALTESHLNKIAVLQAVVMNLQIGCIRSSGHLRQDISSLVSPPCSVRRSIPVTEELNSIAATLIEVMRPFLEVLFDSKVLPTRDHQKIVNFSRKFLYSKIGENDHLRTVLADLESLLDIYDTLMCEGITAFAIDLREKTSKRVSVRHIVEANAFLKTSFLMSDPLQEDFKFHKLDGCSKIIDDILFKYGHEKSIVVILCRSRNASWLQKLSSVLTGKFNGKPVSVVCGDPSCSSVCALPPSSMKDKMCNLIITSCTAETFTLSVGYVDAVICFDEGLSVLHYVNGINVSNDGQIYTLFTHDYEVNVDRVDSIDYGVDAIEGSLLKAVNLCKDNVRIFPPDWHPKIEEYWAELSSMSLGGSKFIEYAIYSPGLLSTFEAIAVRERTKALGGLKEVFLKSQNAMGLITSHAEENLMWLDKPQTSKNVSASDTTLKIVGVVGADDETLSAESERLKAKLREKSFFDSAFEELSLDSVLVQSLPDVPASKAGNAISGSQCNVISNLAAPPVKRIKSASISSFLTKTSKPTRDCYFDPLEHSSAVCERASQMKKIIVHLKKVIYLSSSLNSPPTVK